MVVLKAKTPNKPGDIRLPKVVVAAMSNMSGLVSNLTKTVEPNFDLAHKSDLK